MPGTTGKRARPAGICITCGKRIEPGRSFMRLRKGDEHIGCWERRELPHHFSAKEGRKPCIGNDPACPCQDGDMCHYEGPNAWPIPEGA